MVFGLVIATWLTIGMLLLGEGTCQHLRWTLCQSMLECELTVVEVTFSGSEAKSMRSKRTFNA